MSIKKTAFVSVVAVFFLASCNTGEGKVSTSQQGMFVTRPQSRVPLPHKPSNVAVADFNKDGRLDLIVSSDQARTVTVLLGDKAGGAFRAGTAQPFTLPESPGEMVLGDVNGDDRLDVALDSHDSYNVTLLLGIEGGFRLAPNSPIVMKKGQHPHTHGLGLGDLNGDGTLDLATSNNADNDVSVAFGDGRGGFTIAPRSPFVVGPSPYPLTLGDMNNDGRLDIVANASATGPNRARQLAMSRALTLLIADGRGDFRRSEIPLRTGEPWFQAIGDLNGDRKPDLVATHHEQNFLTVLLGDGSGGFRETASSPLNLGRDVWRIVLADVNRDRRPDVIGAAGDGILVMLGDGAGSFSPAPQSPFATARGTWRLAIGDMDQDGKLDVVTSNTDNNSVTVLFGN